MTLAYLVLAVVLGASLLGAPKTTPQQKPQPEPVGPGKKVRIVVGSFASLDEQCKAGKFQAVDILVDEKPDQKEPYHCARAKGGPQVLPHEKAHQDPNTILQLGHKAKESVVWYIDSGTPFRIAAIKLSGTDPKNPKDLKLAPPNPFFIDIPTQESTRIDSGPIRENAAYYRYKITLMIGKRLVDPDIWCNP
jgi:hypothetical protein